MKKNNVIQFPQDRVKRSKKPDVLSVYKKYFGEQKVAIPALVVFILGAVAAINQITFSNNVKSGVRGLASINSSSSEALRDATWEYDIAAELAKGRPVKYDRDIASNPSELQKLLIGYFQGKYYVSLRKNKISRISFSGEVGQSPLKVDLDHFLKNHRGLMPVSFTKIEQGRDRHIGEKREKYYTLLNEKNSDKAIISFIVDKDNRLLSMKVQDLIKQ